MARTIFSGEPRLQMGLFPDTAYTTCSSSVLEARQLQDEPYPPTPPQGRQLRYGSGVKV